LKAEVLARVRVKPLAQIDVAYIKAARGQAQVVDPEYAAKPRRPNWISWPERRQFMCPARCDVFVRDEDTTRAKHTSDF
jgi:hypothetical protein